MTTSCVRQDIDQAVKVLRQGGVIAFPTETYYGLGVDPFNTKSLERLYRIKRRSKAKPFLLLIEQLSQLTLLTGHIPLEMSLLMTSFWPGPLTLIFPAQSSASSLLTGETETIGIRQSPHPCVKKLLGRFGSPITGTSANISGQAPATTARQVADVFDSSEVDFILDGGPTPGGKGSTLVGYDGQISCVREGQIPFTVVLAALKNLTIS